MPGTTEKEDWKSKYRDLLGELEARQLDWRALDEMLRSVASRLAIAATGRDPAVDQKLDEIRESIKSRAGIEILSGQLEALGRAVAEHERKLSGTASIDLSGFVSDLVLPREAHRRFIERLELGTETAQAQTLKELASELNQRLHSNDTGIDESATNTATDTTTIANSVFALLLNHIRTVPALADAMNGFEHSLEVGASIDDWDAPLSSLVAAIGDIIDTIEQEKNELEEFLGHVTEQLQTFEKWALWQESASQGRLKNTDDFGDDFKQQVNELHADIEASTDLQDLKVQVQTRLDSIAYQLSAYRKREQHRSNDAEAHNVLLREELNKLKVRTAELAQRCGDQETRLMLDTLTGVHSRYAYQRRIQEEFQRWQRDPQPLSYSIWDIDFFKSVNDNCGHQAGDRLLKIIAGMLSKQTRTEDWVARIGGDEFIIIFPNTPIATASVMVERLRDKVASAAFQHNGTPMQVTLSCGLTEFRSGDTPEVVYGRADKALYEAKNTGANRCITY